MSTRHETNHKYSSRVILSRNTYRKIDSNACEKKEVVSVFVWNGKTEEGEKIA